MDKKVNYEVGQEVVFKELDKIGFEIADDEGVVLSLDKDGSAYVRLGKNNTDVVLS